jgi:predicted CDP-diglyceride synthetase/phosphatidate cytidylyltransferase
MGEESLLGFVSSLTSLVHGLQWPIEVWWALMVVFAGSLLFCARELILWFSGYYALKKELTLVQARLADVQGDFQDLKERVQMLEAGVEGFDLEEEEPEQRFEIHH